MLLLLDTACTICLEAAAECTGYMDYLMGLLLAPICTKDPGQCWWLSGFTLFHKLNTSALQPERGPESWILRDTL